MINFEYRLRSPEMHSTSDEIRPCVLFIKKFGGSTEKALQKVKMSDQFAESCVTGQGRGMTTHFAHRINMRVVKMHKTQATSGCTAGRCLQIAQLGNAFHRQR